MFAPALLLLGSSATLINAAKIRVDGPDLHVKDVVDGLSAAGWAAGSASRVIARLPMRQRVVLSRRGVAALVRRALPGLRMQASPFSGTLIILRSPAAKPGRAHACFAAAHAIAAGAFLDGNSIEPAVCDPASTNTLSFDRKRGRLIARAPIAVGTRLGPMVLPVEPEVEPGTRMSLTSTSGPVMVQRAVIAMQMGRMGRKVFVKDGKNNVFAVPVGAMP